MAKYRFTKSIPKLRENPYPDGNLTFRTFMWELYKETISCTEDERHYSNSLVKFLAKNALLVESYAKIEREIKESDDDMPFYAGGFTLYLYRDNLVTIRQQDGGTVTIDCYHPTSLPCIINEFTRYVIKEKGDSKVSILVSRNGGLVAQKVTFAPPLIADLDLNYGTGFKAKHDQIVKKLNAKGAKLFVFSGLPGSGKSTYLKHLTSIIQREFIFIPVNMADRLGSPDFISLLMGKKDAILILEDAEQAVQQRGTGGDDSAVATLLNISDGILGSLLNISIVVTFNAERGQMDKALMRKGRLAFDYDFGALKVEDARRLAKHLKKEIEIKTPMTLADIYGSDDQTNHTLPEPPRQMGFHTLIKSSSLTPKIEAIKEKAESSEKT